jgi:hypothetical protein
MSWTGIIKGILEFLLGWMKKKEEKATAAEVAKVEEEVKNAVKSQDPSAVTMAADRANRLRRR